VRARSLFGICLIALTVAACSDDKAATPTQPTAQPPATPPTLTAPAVDVPEDDQQLDTLRPTLRVANATSNQTGAKTYEFQVSDSSDFAAMSASGYARIFKLVSAKAGIAEDASGKTSYEVTDDLQPTTRFYWRARVRQGTTDGPWSATRSFKTQVQGYNRPGELYDPLTNGQTVGVPVGNIQVIPGKGFQVLSNDSHVRYQLAQTLTSGEFSLEMEGVNNDTPGDKTKILSMYDGNGDITTSRYRFTVEKRDGGVIAWRYIAGGDCCQIDTVGGERVPVNFNPGQTYGVKASWGGGFSLKIYAGGMGGAKVYDFGKGVGGTYNPQPHMGYLGSPIGRAGPNDASVVGAIYRNVYIGNTGRPASLGSALVPKGQATTFSTKR
jgi:hypothetical protein